MILAKKMLKAAAAGFAGLVLLVFLFTRPEKLGDLVGAALDGVIKGAESLVIVVDRATQ